MTRPTAHAPHAFPRRPLSRRRFSAALILAALTPLAAPAALAQDKGGAAADAIPEARSAAQTLIDDAHDAIHAGGGMGALEAVISRHFNFPFWERYMLGDDSQGMTEAQLAEFRRLLPAYIARLYKNQLAGGDAGKPQITGARKARKDVFVQAEIPRGGGKKPIPAEWRMRAADGPHPKVIDIIAGGVSFLVLKRSEFRSVAKREGVDAMLTKMAEISAGKNR